MNEWIQFYRKVDEGTKGSLSTTLILVVIPMILGAILYSIDIILLEYLMNMKEPIDTASSVWYKDLILIAINYALVVGGVFVGMIVLALGFMILSSIWTWLVERFNGVKNFINIVKTAKTESFDNSKVNLDPKKQEMKIKG